MKGGAEVNNFKFKKGLGSVQIFSESEKEKNDSITVYSLKLLQLVADAFDLKINFAESPEDRILISRFFPTKSIRWIVLNETQKSIDLRLPIEFYPNTNGYYSGTD